MNWLKKKRQELKLTQKELAEKSGVNQLTIENIEQERRKGSQKTLDALNAYFDSIAKSNLSYECEELIEELEEDIAVFGEEQLLYAMFEIIDNSLFLTNYDFITKEEPLTEEEKSEYKMIVELKAKDILKLLEMQNKIL